jgi:glycosyltransferase involved in cell wall biosynthesis
MSNPGRAATSDISIPSVGRRPRLLVAVTDSISCALLQGQLAYARRRGFDVALLCSPGTVSERTAERERVTLFPVTMKRRISPGRDLMALVEIYRALRQFRPDIVNAGTPKAGLLVTLAAWLCHVPCRIYTLRGLYLETASGPSRLFLETMERLTSSMAGRVICVSRSLRDRAVSWRLIANRKAIVLGCGSSNGVDLSAFTPTPELQVRGQQLRLAAGIGDDAIVIGFVGRLVRDKGLLDLVTAWTRLREQFDTVHLWIIGSFEADGISASMRDYVERDPRVHLLGAVDEVAAHYAAMDVLVLPTYREGLPNVLLEAGAMRLPVVATSVTGCIDVVDDGVTGTLVPPRNPVALAEAMALYVGDRNLRRRHGEAGRVRVERDFAREHVWELLHGEYCDLLRTHGLTPPAGDEDGCASHRTHRNLDAAVPQPVARPPSPI